MAEVEIDDEAALAAIVRFVEECRNDPEVVEALIKAEVALTEPVEAIRAQYHVSPPVYYPKVLAALHAKRAANAQATPPAPEPRPTPLGRRNFAATPRG
jgi:hypothetical protein